MPISKNLPPSPYHILILLQKSTNHSHLNHLKQIHSHLTTSGHLLTTCKWINTLLYTSLIQSYTSIFQPKSTLLLFTHMLFHNAPPNKLTFPSLIKSTTSSPSSSLFGQPLHAQVIKRGLYHDPFIQTSLIKMYSCFCEILNARQVFDEMFERCVVSCNAMIDGFVKNGDLGSGLSLFLEMEVRDVYSWTSLINGYTRNECFFEAIDLFGRMMREGLVRANEATFVSVLSSCGSFDGVGGLFKGKEVHGFMIRNEFALSVFMGTALISFYGKRGCLGYSIRVFEKMAIKEPCAWNALISILALNGREKEALEMFEKMKNGGWTPNEVTFVAVLSACARAKLVDLGLELFWSMSKGFNVIPKMEHYGCIVDMLGRAGLLKEAYLFVKSMPFKADASVFGALLGACRVHGDVQLGNEVGKLLLELQPYHCGRYVILSSIYAEAEKWDSASNLRKKMVDAGIDKIPAYSMIP